MHKNQYQFKDKKIRMNDSPEQTDPFFYIPPNNGLNACVGRQGHELNYLDGYISAAFYLSKMLHKDRTMFHEMDTLVLPILYNTRHAIELLLKYVERKMAEAGIIQPQHVNHDISKYWSQLDKSAIGDSETRQYIAELKPYIKSLEAIDKDGQQFRFATDRTGENLSMQEISVINIHTLHTSIVKLKELLQNLQFRVEKFCEEKNTGTYTKECSRADLIDIAKMLPHYTLWGNQNSDFVAAKAAIKAKYHISNEKFSDAIRVIKRERKTRLLIGLETKLLHITDEHVLLVVAEWSKENPPRVKSSEPSAFSYSDFERELYNSALPSAAETLVKHLTLDELIDLETIFYLARDNYYPEDYERCFSVNKKCYRSDDPLSEVLGLLSKLNLVQCLARGVKELGRATLASQISSARPDCT